MCQCAQWPIDISGLFLRLCHWTLIWLSCHRAWLCQGSWCCRNLIEWLKARIQFTLHICCGFFCNWECYRSSMWPLIADYKSEHLTVDSNAQCACKSRSPSITRIGPILSNSMGPMDRQWAQGFGLLVTLKLFVYHFTWLYTKICEPMC